MLFPIKRGKLLTIKYEVSSRFFTDAFYQTEEVPFIPSLMKDFIMNGCCLFYVY